MTSQSKSFGKKKIPRLLLNAGDQKHDTVTFKKLGFEMLIVPDVGHFIMLEKPDESNKEVINFFVGKGMAK